MKGYQILAIVLIGGVMFWAYAQNQESKLQSAQIETAPARIDKGAVLTMTLETPLSSERSQVGDPVRAVLSSDVYDGEKVVLTKGTPVYGEVVRVAPSSVTSDKRGRLGFALNEIDGPNGRMPASMTILSSGLQENQADRTARTRTQLAGTAIGTLVGINIASNEKKRGSDKVKHGLLGGAAGLAVGSLVAHQQGVDVEIPAGSRIKARVENVIEIR